jgi:hypothetical protein
MSGAILHTPIFHHGVDRETSPFFTCHLHDDRKTFNNMEAHKRPFVVGGLNHDLPAITDTCLAYKQKSTWKKVTNVEENKEKLRIRKYFTLFVPCIVTL